MRILFVHNGSDLYGASRSLMRLAQGLARENHELFCVVPHDGPLVKSLQKIPVRVILHTDLGVLRRQDMRSLRGIMRFLLNMCSSTFNLFRLIKTLKPDVVHTNTAVIPSSSLAARLASSHHIQHIREFFGEFGILWIPYRAFLLFCANTVVCVSSIVEKQFPIGNRKTLTIHDGRLLDEFPETPASVASEFRQKHGIGGGPIVGVVGRIKFHRKGQEILVQAAHLLREKHPTLQVLIVGSPFPGNEDHLARLGAVIKQLDMQGRTILTGDVENVGVVYNVLDILVMPSCIPEPFGGVVTEAMAYGKPVICNKGGGGEEQIEHGVTGLLVDPCDPLELSKALDTLLSDADLCRAMGERARARFLERFEFESFFEQMKRLYDTD